MRVAYLSLMFGDIIYYDYIVQGQRWANLGEMLEKLFLTIATTIR